MFLLPVEEAVNFSLNDLWYSGICGKYISRITPGKIKTASLYLLTLAHNTRTMSTADCLCLISHGDDVVGLCLFLVLSRLQELVDLRSPCASYGAGKMLALACGCAESLPGVEIQARKERYQLTSVVSPLKISS